MPRFAKRSTQPPRPDTYRRLARLVRGLADKIEALSDPQSPQERRRLTMALTSLMRLTRHSWRRHCGHTLDEPPPVLAEPRDGA